MGGSRASADGSPDQESRSAADPPADQHPGASSASHFDLISAVVTRSLELSFFVDIGSVDVGIDQHGVQHEALAVGQDDMLGEDPDRRLALDPPGLAQSRDTALH